MSRRRAQNGARWSTKWGVAEPRVECRFAGFRGNSGFGEGIRRNKWLFASVERNIQANCRHIFHSTKFNAKKNKSSKFLVSFTKSRIFAATESATLLVERPANQGGSFTFNTMRKTYTKQPLCPPRPVWES